MQGNIKDVCKEIDDNLLRNLELMEEKINVNIQIEKILRDGHIELAKAKYIRGKESISILQVPADEERVATLFELETMFTKETEENIPNFDISLKKMNKDKEEILDPIKWFGVLVPQCLRIGQKRFQESVYLIAKAANIQAEIISVTDRMQFLYSLKNSSYVNNSTT